MGIPSDAGSWRATGRDGALHIRKGGRWVASAAAGAALASLAALSTIGVGVIEQTGPSVYAVKAATFGHTGGRWIAAGTFTGDRTYTWPDASGIPAISATALTSTRVPVAAAGGLLQDFAAFTADSGHVNMAADGTAGAPAFRLGASEVHGFYRVSATAIGVSVGGTAAITLGTAGIVLQYASAGSGSYGGQQTDGLTIYMAGPSTGAGGQLRAYGSTHATKANYRELSRGATVDWYLDGSGNVNQTGNWTQSGATTLVTGTGGVTVNGDTNIAGKFLRLNAATNTSKLVLDAASWGDTKFDSQGTAWSSRTIGTGIIFNDGASNRPEISWYRGGRTYPEFSIREHTTNDTGGEIWAGGGTAQPTLALSISPTYLIVGPGTTTPAVAFSGTNIPPGLQLNAISTAGCTQAIGQWINDAAGPNLILTKSRGGVIGTHVVVNASDRLGSIIWDGSDGAAFQPAVRMYGTVDGAPGAGSMPGKWVLATSATGSGTPTDRLTVDATGKVLALSPLGGLGYGTGAGGTVTQITSKATGVTLNKVVGAITLNAASLAATTSAGFTLTNSAIAVGDAVLVSISSGATADAYTVTVDAIAAGSCRISLRNVTAGALAEAVVLTFAVIKGATA